MKKFRFIFAAFILLFCFQNQVYAADQTIKIRVTEFPPNYYTDKDGNWKGLGVELSSKIVKTAGFEPVFVSEPWIRALKSLKEGSIQYITNIGKTDERSEFLNWIGPVRQDEMRLIVKKGNENLPVRKLDDLITVSREKKMKFGYQEGLRYSDEFQTRFDSDPEFRNSFEIVTRSDWNFNVVLAGRILGFFELNSSMRYQIENDPVKRELAVHSFVLRKTDVYHGISKKGVDRATFDKIRNAFEKLQKNGELQHIINKYYNQN